jgi:hypothetical protein
MPFSHAFDRVRADFMEMPGLELTLPQAVRLWGLGMDDCRCVLDSLVDAGFLRWTFRRTVMRTTLPWSGTVVAAYASVSQDKRTDRSVSVA